MNHNVQKRDRARQLLDSGSIAEALFLLEQDIRESPSDIDLIYLLGICYARSGRYANAEKCFSKTVKINRDFFQAYTDMGLSQSRQKKFIQAIKSFKKSLKINPKFAPAHSNIALAYLKTGEIRKALQHAKKSVEIDGGNPHFLNVQALCYRQSNQIEKAIDAFKEIISTFPAFFGAYQNLCETYALSNDISNAEKVLLSARVHFKNNATVYASLGKLYEKSHRAEKARDAYAEGIASCGENPDLLVSLGRANRILENFDEGLKQIEEALRINSAYQPAIAERCSFFILKGEYDQAYSFLETFISSERKQPLTGGLSMAYAHICRLTNRYEESIGVLKKTLDTPEIPNEMTSVILFSLGESYDKMKLYDSAFTAYRKANTVERKDSDIGLYLNILNDVQRGVNSSTQANTIRSDIDSSKPVFIVGMPRSGTSLVEQIIASHPEAHGAGEITELWSIGQDISESKNYQNYIEKLSLVNADGINAYARRYLGFIENLEPNASRITDKLPHNFLHIGLIRQLFPNANIIHCHRHPFDTCLSIYFKRFNDSHLYARHLSDIARFYVQYKTLMDLWEATDARIFNLKYEDLVANTQGVTRDIISYIGLGWDEQCLRYHESDRLIATPSYTQANRAIYTDSLNRWKNYRSHLQPLIDVLGDPEQYQ